MPLNAMKEYLLGHDLCHLGRKYYKEGRKHLINAILMDPTYIYAYLTLADTYIATKKFDRAQKLLQIAYHLNPTQRDTQQTFFKFIQKANKQNLAQYIANSKPIPLYLQV